MTILKYKSKTYSSINVLFVVCYCGANYCENFFSVLNVKDARTELKRMPNIAIISFHVAMKKKIEALGNSSKDF